MSKWASLDPDTRRRQQEQHNAATRRCRARKRGENVPLLKPGPKMGVYATPIAERLWKRVAKGDPESCWLWTGSVCSDGYGTIGTTGNGIGGDKVVGVHRVAYEAEFGPIPVGMCVCHKCDNPRCCNPAHLFLGTVRDNVYDCIAKGRRGWQRLRKSA